MANEKLHENYRVFLLGEPCRCQPCVSPVVIHHNTFGETEQHAKSLGGKRGKGQRASDLEGMPLCNRHHRDLHDLRGFFSEFDKHSLREWQARQVRELQSAFAMRCPEPATAATSSRATRKRIGSGWTVALVRDWLSREAPTRPGPVAAALIELHDLLGEDTR